MIRISLVLLALLPCIVLAHGKTEGVHTVFHLHWSDCAFVEKDATLRVTQGDPVTLHVHGDTQIELHLHGYDESITVPANGEVKHRFVADIAGRFSVALHGGCIDGGHDHGRDHGNGHETVFYLEVLPK